MLLSILQLPGDVTLTLSWSNTEIHRCKISLRTSFYPSNQSSCRLRRTKPTQILLLSFPFSLVAMSTSEEYLKAFRENRVISLGKLWRSTPRDEIERLIKDVEGCQDCVLYWPLITGLKPGEYHIGWCNAAFPDQATAQRSQGRLDGFLIVARTIRASKAFSPIVS